MNQSPSGEARARREPPPFRRVEVVRTEQPTPRMVRVVFTGRDLEGLAVDLPAASVRLLVPSPGAGELVIPVWNGNEFLLPGGERPIIRTFTPRRVAADALELDLDIVIHDAGAVSGWASSAEAGASAAVSGPGRGYEIDRDAPGFVLAGDETAIPAICQLLDAIPPETPVLVVVEVTHPEARFPLPAHPGATVLWCDLPPGAPPGEAWVGTVADASLDPGVRVWAAGEAAAVQQVRRHLFEERGFPRAQVTARGYWKHGR